MYMEAFWNEISSTMQFILEYFNQKYMRKYGKILKVVNSGFWINELTTLFSSS